MTATKPATTDTTQAVQHEQRVRRSLRLFGLVLWMLVVAGLFVVWRQRRNRPTGPSSTLPQPAVLLETPDEKSPPSGNLASVSSTPNSARSDRLSSKGSDTIRKPNSASHRPIWDPNGIGDFSLTERSGKTVTKAELLGHPWAVCFIFTRCAGPCLRISAQMYKLQTSLKNKNVRLVTITVDPKYDSPKILRRYAEMFGADPDRWLFLTGNQREIHRLIYRSFRLPVKEMLGEDRKPGYEVLHSTYVLHVDAFGRVIDKYDARIDSDIVALRRALDRDQSTAEYRAWRRPLMAPKPPAGGSLREDH